MEDIWRLVFIYASHVDWKSPIRVGLTCKWWRYIILGTPAVWRLDKLHHIPADRVEMWIARSGDHRKISLIVPRVATVQWVNAITPHRRRIKQLRLHSHHHVLTQHFPMVQALELFENWEVHAANEPPESPIQIYSRNITSELYPSLQSLYIISDKWRGGIQMNPISAPILVTKLFVESRYMKSWAPLLSATTSTVVDLTLKVTPGFQSMTSLAIAFPKVMALTISGQDLPLDLATPRMTFLRLQNCHERVLSSIDVSGVTSLILDRRIPYSTHRFPAITRILIHPDTSGVLTFLRYLSNNFENHPSLSMVIIPWECQIPDLTLNACYDHGIFVGMTKGHNELEDKWRPSHIHLAQ